jgi:4-hydroxy-tetrahydrodipicolinate reductase
MTTPIIVHGAHGRMGQAILALAATDPTVRVVCGVDRTAGSAGAVPIRTEIPQEPGAVVIDFSHPSAFAGVCAACAKAGMALVSGTTGLDPAALDAGLTPVAARAGVLHAQNMSVGVQVVLRVAAQLATVLGEAYDIEIVETHHNQKKDAPSGTAFALADAILAATGRTRDDLVPGRSGEVGARTRREIGIHALRLGDVVGDHTVYFVGNGERIQIGHVAHRRDIFAAGAVRAAAWIAGRAPGRYHMADVLGL